MQQVNIHRLVQLDFRAEEALKALRSNIQFCGDGMKCIAFTSDMPGEGKSNIAWQLALSFVELGKKVIFVDTDIRKSVLEKRYDINGIRYGLSHLLSGQVRLEDCIAETNINGFNLIIAGVNAPNPSELLSSNKFKEMLVVLKEQYDYVLVDTLPMGSVIDGAIVGGLCDGVIWVLEENKVSRQVALTMKRQLEYAKCKILGVVLNKVSMQNRSYYKKYGNYYGEYSSRTSVLRRKIKRKEEKGKKIAALVLLVVSICFSAFFMHVAAKQDRVAPQIVVENETELILYDGVDESTLLEGVLAIDEVDGDVSDSLIVQKIYYTKEDMGVAVIAAKDSSNNMSTIDREFILREAEAGNEPAKSSEDEQNNSSEIGKISSAQEIKEETKDNEDSSQEREEESHLNELSQDVISEEEYAEIRAQNLAAGIPFIRMVQHTITVSVGQTVAFSGAMFNVVDYIREAVDDKDDAERYIHMDGNVDSNVKGTYPLQIYVVDSDGNQSNVEKFIVTVK